MNYISMFSGIEAASVAWEPMGWKPLIFSDIDEFSDAVLKYHWPSIPNVGDMSKVDWKNWTNYTKGTPHEHIDTCDLVVGGSPCFPAGYLVTTDRGQVPIEEIQVGDMVLTHTGKFQRVMRIGGKYAPTVMLKGQGHWGLETTDNHPFYAVEMVREWVRGKGRTGYLAKNPSSPSWVGAKDMVGRFWTSHEKITDTTIPNLTLEGNETTPNIGDDRTLMFIAGMYVGDGWERHDSRRGVVYLGINEKKWKTLQSKVPGLFSFDSQDGKAIKVKCHNRSLARWLSTFGNGAKNKTIPTWVFGIDADSRQSFLDGYFQTDGHFLPNGKRFTTASRSLAISVKMLIATLGYSTTICRIEPSRDECVIDGRKVNESPYFQVSMFNTSRSSFSHLGLRCGLVRSVTEINEPKQVFNLEVENDNSYVLDGFIVHNCQAFSTAGLRKSLDDPRGNLTLEFMRGIRDIKPRWFVWENVLGALTADQNPFGCFLAGLCGYDDPLIPPGFQEGGNKPYSGEAADDQGDLYGEWGSAAGFKDLLPGSGRYSPTWPRAGFVCRAPGNGSDSGLHYSVAWRVLDAQYFGVPQRRNRIFAVGYSGPEWWKPLEVLFERDGLPRNFETLRKKGQDNSDDLADGSGETGGFGGETGDRGRGSSGPGLTLFDEHQFSGFRESGVAGTLKRSGGAIGGGSENLVVEGSAEGTTVFQPGMMSRMGGHVWNDTAPTLTKQGRDNRPCIIDEPKSSCIGFNVNQDAGTVGDDSVPTLRKNNVQGVVYDDAEGVDLYNTAVTGDVATTLTKAGGGTSTGPSIMMGIKLLCPTCKCEWRMPVSGSFHFKQMLKDVDCPNAPTCDNQGGKPSYVGVMVNQVGLRQSESKDSSFAKGFEDEGVMASGFDGNITGDVVGTMTRRTGSVSDSAHFLMVDEEKVQAASFAGGEPQDVAGTLTRCHGGAGTTANYLVVDGEPKTVDGRNLKESEVVEPLTRCCGRVTDTSNFITEPPPAAPQMVHENDREELRLMDVATAVTTGGGKPGQGYPTTLTGERMPILRRLTPIETERLQGFPDNHTKIPFKGKELADCPDGRRYAACGNSMAVPVMRWIGSRIALADVMEGSTELPLDLQNTAKANKRKAFFGG